MTWPGELWHIRSGGQEEPNFLAVPRVLVILIDTLSNLSRGHPHDWICVGVVARGALKDLDAEHAFLETARETYERSLAAAAAAVPDVTVSWEIRSGDVVDTLADLDDADVLICGSRGYGPGRRVLLGGVSARLVRQARRPVVVVPRSG